MATAKKKPAGKGLKKPAAKKKPVRRVAKKPDELYFEVMHNHGGRDYLMAESKYDADQIESRLRILVRSKKVRSYDRFADGSDEYNALPITLFVLRTPDDILKI